MRLSHATLDTLPGDVMRAKYDPRTVGTGVVHLGIGAFHRAHQAAYFDDLIAAGAGDWRICGVSLRSPDVRDRLVPQDCLYTLVEQGVRGIRKRVIGAIADVLVAREDPARVIAAIADPATRLVTLTVTEKGYCHDPATGRLDTGHADIAHDLASRDKPVSAIGYLVAGCARRRAETGAPLTILSCDNVPHNGALLRGVMVAFAALRDPSLAVWIADNVAFPSSMVDRIVPATTDADVAELARVTGVVDTAMVKAEPFTQWVIEDCFADRRPAFESVGAQMVSDVRPFELAKLRMLNGAHSTIAYLGLHHGISTVDEAMSHPDIAAVADALMVEAASTLPPVPGLDPRGYAAALKHRFANPALKHRLAQIAMDGSQKLPQRLLGTIKAVHDRGDVPRAAATGVAAWMRHLSGPYLNDPLAERLRAAAHDDPEQLVAAALAIEPVFGELGRARWFRDLLVEVMP